MTSKSASPGRKNSAKKESRGSSTALPPPPAVPPPAAAAAVSDDDDDSRTGVSNVLMVSLVFVAHTAANATLLSAFNSNRCLLW